MSVNLAPAAGLVTLTWGNASAIDHELGCVAIKPSGVSYPTMTVDDIVVLTLQGEVVAGSGRPFTDTPTHLSLYRAFPYVGGVVHTHSTSATAWAQAEHALLGTTPASFSPHAVPLTRHLTETEVAQCYGAAIGKAIIEAITIHGPAEVPAALVRQHGPFCWAQNIDKAVEAAITLEEIARMASITQTIEPHPNALDPSLRNKHYERKHGPDAYCGQPG